MSIIGAVVASEKIILVEGEVRDDGTIALIKDEKFNLEDGDRQRAYKTMHQRISDRLGRGVEQVVLKASSANKFTASQDALHAAELRGVFLSAIPDGVEVKQPHKKNLSRDYGSRKIDEYIKDDDWWSKYFIGECRKGSREAAILILTRNA